MGADSSRDLVPEKRLILRAAGSSREKRFIPLGRQMRPKLPNVALEKIDAFRRERVFERLAVFDLFGRDDDVQRLALTRSDEISLDIQLDEIAHADRRHQQDLDRDGHLGPHRASLEIWVPPGLTHQLLREL